MDFGKINYLEKTLRQTLRLGKVVDVIPERGAARVQFTDQSDMISGEMPVLTPRSAKDGFYCMPRPDEYVLCAFIPSAPENGFILGSYYSETAPPPRSESSVFAAVFEDGTELEYDGESHRLLLSVEGEAEIVVSGSVRIKSAAAAAIECENASVNASNAASVTCADVSVKASGSASLECSEASVKAEGSVGVKCSSAKIEADEAAVEAPSVSLGKGALSGVVTQNCVCSFTGAPHAAASASVKAAL